MPAGGTWTVQNKIRPGAYINFVSVPKAVGTLGDRGTVAVGMPMTWGPANELIHLTGDDLLNGASLAKVGVMATDTEESLPYRVALAGCFNALLFRTDVGGTKAVATIVDGTLKASAKYAGTTGNTITISIIKDKPEVGSHTVHVLVRGVMRESFVVTNMGDFETIDSAFVDFSVMNTGATVPAVAGMGLTGGTNGAVSKDVYPNFWSLLDTKNFECVAMYDTDATVASLLKSKVEVWREKRGKKVQAVVYNYTEADYEGLISVDQGFKTATETVDTTMFMLWAASMTAGARVNQSLTAAVVEGAVEIINPIAEDEIADALSLGKFVITYRQDGAVCVEKDINTLHTFTVDKNQAFSKNRVVRCLDEIGNTTALVFNRNYAGKVDNDAVGRNLYKAELISMFDTLVGIRAITNFSGASDITVLPGETTDSVVVDVVVQPVDSMEKLYMTVNVNA